MPVFIIEYSKRLMSKHVFEVLSDEIGECHKKEQGVGNQLPSSSDAPIRISL